MAAVQDETACDSFTASVSFDASQIGTIFQWGVLADLTGSPNTWVVVTEVPMETQTSAIEASLSPMGNFGRITGW
jgi:hypothetical protein